MQTQDSTDDRRVVPIEEAIKRIGKGRRIHTFKSGPGLVVGADWSRNELIDAMRTQGVEESGPAAAGMGHTLVIVNYNGSPLFIQAAPAKVSK